VKIIIVSNHLVRIHIEMIIFKPIGPHLIIIEVQLIF